MINLFHDIAGSIENDFIKEWKNEEKKIIGYTCSYLPEEILHAMEILPYRLRGNGAESTTIGDTYFGPFICSFPKCLLQLAGEGKYGFLDGAVITNGCDSMRRLDECWRKAGDDIEQVIPSFFHYFGVPHKSKTYSVKWFVDEIEEMIAQLQSHFNVKLDEEKLAESIKLYNKTRMLLGKLEDIRVNKNISLSGVDALAIILSAAAMPREKYNSLLEDTLENLNEKESSTENKKRLMLVGSANDDIELVRLIEGESAHVVADNLCFGPRQYEDMVDENESPLKALSERYLASSECPRMFGDYKMRLKILEDKIQKYSIDGVVLQNIRFCDLHGSENGLFESALEKQGIPCLRLEREYGPLVESGRVKMRVDAFMERLG